MKRKLSFVALLILFKFNYLISQSLNYCNWQYKRDVTIDHTQNPENVTDYSVLVIVNTLNLIAEGKIKPDGSDIRFTTNYSDNLEYWVEPGIQNEFGMNQISTHIWVKIPVIYANTSQTIYMFYGNPNANPKSNISTTFLFGDDFDDNNLDALKWQVDYIASGALNEQNNRLEHQSPPSFPESTGSILSQEAFTGSVVVDMQFKKGGYVYRGAGLYDAFNSVDNRAIFFWQDYGPFGPQLSINSNNVAYDFRSDFWSREVNPEYYLRIYRKADGTFKFVSEIPSFEEDGYKYWEHTLPNTMSTNVPLKVGAHDFVWQAATPTWDRYEDNIRVRKYSEPEPVVLIQEEQMLVLQNTFVENASICENENYNWQGNTYNQTGSYSINFTTSEGCDSVLTLNLMVNPSYQITENKVISNGTIYTWHGQTLTSAGIYSASYTTLSGCDSLFTLNLLISSDVEELCNWQYKREVFVDHTQNPENLTDYTVLLTINTMELINQGKMNADGSDIRFTTDFSDNLEYWIEPGIQNEFGINDDATHVWVKIPFLTATSTKTIYMLYGNQTASPKSSISSAFLFGDDFNDNTVDLTKWDVNYLASGSLIEQNNRLEHQSPSTFPESRSSIFSKETFTGPIVVDMQFKKGGYVYRGAGLKQEHDVETNKAYFHWQDWGAFGPTIDVNGSNEVNEFRSDYWSREVNPEYYLRIYRKPDGTFRFVGEIPSFEEDGYQYWEHTFTNYTMPLSQPLKVGSHEHVWQNAWWLWDRYEDNIRVRKYSEPEPSVAILTEQINSFSENVSLCIGDSVLWNGFYYSQPGTYTFINSNSIDCASTQTLVLSNYPNYTFSETHAICEGEVFNWQGNNYNNEGTYNLNQLTINGCDSILTLNLIVHPKFNFYENHSICEGESFNWFGVDYSESGVYIANFLSSAGCDSSFTLNLNVEPLFSLIENQTICSGTNYFWQGLNYNQSGTYSINYINSNGCDSVYTLNLIVLDPISISENQTICEGESYFWQGTNYTSPGTYSMFYSNVNGCDSVHTLVLNMKSNYHFSETISICEGESYFWQGSNYSQSGNYLIDYSSIDGCDSTYSLTLNLIPIFSSIENYSICSGETYIWHENEYTQSGTYVLNFTNQNGCDSIFTLNLELNDVNTYVTVLSSILISAQNGASYQWLDCQNNFNELLGANSQSYSPEQTGEYAVEITLGNCVDTSNCYVFNYIGLFETLDENKISIYPNPSSDILYIELVNNDKECAFFVLNTLGEIVYENQFKSKTAIETKNFASGIYTIGLNLNNKIQYLKFIKE